MDVFKTFPPLGTAGRAVLAAETEAEAREAINALPAEAGTIRLDSAVLPYAPAPLTSGCVTFISDDGSAGEFSIYRAMFAARGVPCCAALIAGTIPGQISTGATRTAEYLQLQSEGWEVLNHSSTHQQMANIATEAELDYEINGALDKLRGLGFAVDHMAYPFGSEDERVRRITAQRHRSAFIVGGYPINGYPLNPMAIRRVALGAYASAPDNTLASYQAAVDDAKRTGRWLVFMLHPGQTGDSTEQQGFLADILDYCAAQSVPILTVSQALARLGNIGSFGDRVTTASGGILQGQHGLAVGATGTVYAPLLRAPSLGAQEYGFTRFGVRLPSATAGFADRFCVRGTGTGAAWGAATFDSPNAASGTQRLQRGTVAGNRALIQGPVFDVRSNRRLWARWRMAAGSSLFPSAGRRIFIGVSSTQDAALSSHTALAGIIADDTLGANIHAILRAASTTTTEDLGIATNDNNIASDWLVDLRPGEVLIYRAGRQVARITTNVPTGSNFSPLVQIDGPQTGADDGSIYVRECEYGFNISPFG